MVKSSIQERFGLALGALLLWGLYVAWAAPGVTVGDSGEFITAGATLSLPHAPSYPLYSLSGKAVSVFLSVGNEGYRINLLSALAGVLALIVFFQAQRIVGVSPWGASVGTLFLAFSPAFFHHSLVTEVFQLNSLFGILALMLVVPRKDTENGPALRRLLLSALVLGLGFGNHQTLILLVPALVWAGGGILAATGSRDWKRIIRISSLALIVFIGGLCVYLVLPIRSRQNPSLNWGQPKDLARTYRAILRKDYGTLSLSLGETPSRTVTGFLRQERRFFMALREQVTLPGLVLVILGIVFCFVGKQRAGPIFLLAFLMTGPFFAWLGNLPFDGQSDGILERFYIFPVMALSLFAGFGADGIRRALGPVVVAVLVIPGILFVRSASAYPKRYDYLVNDYSINILRTLPVKATFAMDGGDDTFFGTAYQLYVRRQRPDLTVFDRGGLIFRNPYGSDFRQLTKQEKDRRREEIEKAYLGYSRLFYSTMNERILEDHPLVQRGFLYEALSHAGSIPSGPAPWPFFSLRSIYPPATRDYRTIALTPFFPFMMAKQLFREGTVEESRRALRRAYRMGPRVPWLKSNLVYLYHELAYQLLRADRLDDAERFYRDCLAVDPRNGAAATNLGAIAEKRGALDQSMGWYRLVLEWDPRNPDALYNLAVLNWKKGDWPLVVRLLQQTLEINPAHAGAQAYLPIARQKLQGVRGTSAR